MDSSRALTSYQCHGISTDETRAYLGFTFYKGTMSITSRLNGGEQIGQFRPCRIKMFI